MKELPTWEEINREKNRMHLSEKDMPALERFIYNSEPEASAAGFYSDKEFRRDLLAAVNEIQEEASPEIVEECLRQQINELKDRLITIEKAVEMSDSTVNPESYIRIDNDEISLAIYGPIPQLAEEQDHCECFKKNTYCEKCEPTGA